MWMELVEDRVRRWASVLAVLYFLVLLAYQGARKIKNKSH
jgi:hypothetical protein